MPRQSFFNFSQDALNRILGGTTPPINTGSARTLPEAGLASNQVGGQVGRPYSFGAPSDQVKIWSDPEGVSHVAYRKMIQDQADQAAALQAQQAAALEAQKQMAATSAQQQSAYAAQQAAAQALAQSQAQAAARTQTTVPTVPAATAPAATVQPSYQQQRALRQQQRAAAGAQAQPAPSSPYYNPATPATPIGNPADYWSQYEPSTGQIKAGSTTNNQVVTSSNANDPLIQAALQQGAYNFQRNIATMPQTSSAYPYQQQGLNAYNPYLNYSTVYVAPYTVQPVNTSFYTTL